ncbi:MAG: FKBP-type peptidyl-prolyl cis-trans isomerase [Paludibacteraceae bacterium]|nr:FKBP-type peptidyl-prolyl cis-trans isomerase [Paludibacteraceae bacterium]MBR4712378.1 FKBP-type peptidyl-prolyl cis-trans isomerase [Paludibacteraceae bacterium]
MDKISYALGISMAGNLQNAGFKDLNIEELTRGISDIINGKKPDMTPEEAQQLLNQHFAKLQEAVDKKNKEIGEGFLAENGKQEGVITTASGLQYIVIQEGNGPKPKETDTVRCHYEGRLIDGTVFDSSYRRNQPAEFPVSQVIAGWVEALQLMSTGSKWRLFIPSDLAYGEHGAGDVIRPHSALIFDVELLQIV